MHEIKQHIMIANLRPATTLLFTFILLNGFFLENAFGSISYTDTLVEKHIKRSEYRMVLTIAEKENRKPSKNPDIRLYYSNKLSTGHLYLSNYDSSLMYARASILLTKLSKDSILISEAWKVMAYSLNRSGKLDSALYYTQLLLTYSQRNNDTLNYRNALTSMSTILMQNKRTNEALRYFREVHQISLSIKDSIYLPISYYNMGLAYMKLKKYDSCLAFLNESARLASIHKRYDLQVMALGTIADYYLNTGRMKEWKEYQLKANKVAEKTGNMQFLAMGYSQLAQQSLIEKNYSDAYYHGKQAFKILQIQPYPVLQIRIDSFLYTASKGLGNDKEALYWLESFTKLKNNLLTENQAELLNQMLTKNELREKNLIIANQELKIESTHRKIVAISLFLILILVIIASLIIYFARLSRHRRELYLKVKDMDQQLKELQYRYLSKTIEVRGPHNEDENTGTNNPVEEELDSPTRHQALYNQLLDTIETKKLYLDPELNFKALQVHLGTNKKYLYEAITENAGTNFRGLLNRYRVNEARRLIEASVTSGNNVAIQTLPAESGFNSQGSFYRIFKQFTGLTPNEYMSEFRKEMKSNAVQNIEPNS